MIIGSAKSIHKPEESIESSNPNCSLSKQAATANKRKLDVLMKKFKKIKQTETH